MRALQDTGHRLVEMLEIMGLDPTKVWNSTDRESIEYQDRTNGELTWVNGNELRRMPEQIGSTLYLARQIAELERELKQGGEREA